MNFAGSYMSEFEKSKVANLQGFYWKKKEFNNQILRTQ